MQENALFRRYTGVVKEPFKGRVKVRGPALSPWPHPGLSDLIVACCPGTTSHAPINISRHANSHHVQYNSAGPNPVLSAPEMPDFDPNGGPAPAAAGGAAASGPTRWLFFDSETDEPGATLRLASSPHSRPDAHLPVRCELRRVSLSLSFLLRARAGGSAIDGGNLARPP